jgi:alpha-ketoglutarate-dependent taurine dioxygenase
MTTAINVSPLSDQLGIIVSPGKQNQARAMPVADQISGLFKQHGLILFRGFDLSNEGFIRYTEEVTPGFMDYSGGSYSREKIDGNETVLSVTGNRQFYGVPFHGEMFYTHFRPSVLWFYCFSPPIENGETTACDGIAVLDQLSERTRGLFEKQQIKYIRKYSSDIWHGIYSTTDPDEVAKICAARKTEFTHRAEDDSISIEYQCSAFSSAAYLDRPAFVNNILPVVLQEAKGNTHSFVRMADGSKIPADVIDDIQATTDRLTLAVRWQAQDLLMVDNSRLMHGRRPISDNQRELHVRMSSTIF